MDTGSKSKIKVDGSTYGLEALVSVEILGNGTGTDVEVEAVAVTKNCVKCVSEASGLTLAGFRDIFGGAKARISATSGRQKEENAAR